MSALETSDVVQRPDPSAQSVSDPGSWSVLHLFANYKWTGPADPAIRCAAETRALGARVHFGQAGWKHREGFHRMAVELTRAGMPVRTGLGLRKHFHVPTLVRDRRRLEQWFSPSPLRLGYDVVHTHLLADHLSAAWALSRLRSRRGRARRPILVRHLYEPVAPKWGWREQLAFGRTDGVVIPSASAAQDLMRRFGFSEEQVLVQDPPSRRVEAVDPDPRIRQQLLGDDGDFLIGITARIQPHRNFDLLWDVTAELAKERSSIRIVLFGRGDEDDVQRLCQEPIKERGIERQVVLAGYRQDPVYTQSLQALDAFLFLVPGSDGTCRAVREAQALGLPCVVTDRGMLPEIVGAHREVPGHGPSGIVCRPDRDELATALRSLIDDPSTRAALGRSGVARSVGPRDPERSARRLLRFYDQLRSRPNR